MNWMFGVLCGVLFLAGGMVGTGTEREKWCEYVHTAHKKVEQCIHNPDWEEDE